MKPLCLAWMLVVLVGCGSGDEPAGDQPGDESPKTGPEKPDSGQESPGMPAPPPRQVNPVDAIRSKVKSGDEEERMTAADELTAVPEKHREEAVVLLESMLGDESPEVREVVAMGIGKLGLPRLDAMRARVRVEENEAVKRALIESIFTLGGERAIPDLLPIANDMMLDENFRAYALDALGRLRAMGARDIMESASEDISPVVRRAAVIALGRLGSEASLTVLGERAGDNNNLVQIEAIRGLKKLNKRPCVRYLMNNLDTDEPQVLDELNGALEELTGQKMGYDGTKTVEENADAVAKWKAWWEKNKSYY